MELKHIEQLKALPDTILTEPISIAIEHQDLDTVYIDVGEDCIADFAEYDYEISSAHISAYKGFTTILIRVRKYAPKDIVACIEEEMKWN